GNASSSGSDNNNSMASTAGSSTTSNSNSGNMTSTGGSSTTTTGSSAGSAGSRASSNTGGSIIDRLTGGAATGTNTASEGGFTNTVNLKPAEGATLKVTMRGTGMTVQGNMVDHEMQGNNSFKVTIQGTFAVGGQTPAASTTTGGSTTTGTAGTATAGGNATLGGGGSTSANVAPGGQISGGTASNATSGGALNQSRVLGGPGISNGTSPTTTGSTGTQPTGSAKIMATPSSGLAGDTVTIVGSGFASGQHMTIAMDGTSLNSTPVTGGATETAVSSTTGTFIIRVVIPAATSPGQHQVVASEGAGNTASTPFIVSLSLSDILGTGSAQTSTSPGTGGSSTTSSNTGSSSAGASGTSISGSSTSSG
ncbi:MAG: hypothetical protein C4292_03270, partial [Nitrososphaera sp.]